MHKNPDRTNEPDPNESQVRVLRPDMSVSAFDSGYFYASELKEFARSVGITVGNFRKIELEGLIREYLSTGRVPARKPVLPRKAGEPRDTLSQDEVVTNYVGDKATKDFLLQSVHVQTPGLRDKSGQWYWLNDWRRARQEAGTRFTYGDLANHLHQLMLTTGRLPQIPSARMNNFLSDFRTDAVNAEISRAKALEAWEWLKQQPGPNTYEEYRRRLGDRT